MGTRNGFITIVCRERIFILWNKMTHMSMITAENGAITTRMHSSRMRTGRSLTVCCSLLGGGVCSRGGVCSGGVSAPGGSALGGSGLGGCLLQGVCSRGGVYPSMHWGRHPPPVERIFDTRLWKYYLGPTSLRPVMNTVKALLLPTTPATSRAIPAEMRDLKTSLLIQI